MSRLAALVRLVVTDAAVQLLALAWALWHLAGPAARALRALAGLADRLAGT